MGFGCIVGRMVKRNKSPKHQPSKTFNYTHQQPITAAQVQVNTFTVKVSPKTFPCSVLFLFMFHFLLEFLRTLTIVVKQEVAAPTSSFEFSWLTEELLEAFNNLKRQGGSKG